MSDREIANVYRHKGTGSVCQSSLVASDLEKENTPPWPFSNRTVFQIPVSFANETLNVNIEVQILDDFFFYLFPGEINITVFLLPPIHTMSYFFHFCETNYFNCALL